jgi:light-regulated signal transduction histidine kinase (bacteriophytochrome)
MVPPPSGSSPEAAESQSSAELEQRVRELDLQLADRTRQLETANLELADRTRQLEAAKLQLQATNQELEAFSYSVSHDLRSPLRSIDGFSQALLEDCPEIMDATGRDYLTRIRRGAQRMSMLLDDLLKLSRVSRNELQVDDQDLSGLCLQVLDGLQRSAPERRVELRVQPGLRVRADGRLLQVALEHLLGNAWKFTARTPEPRIEVGATVTPGGERVCFVRDNGAGFDPAYAGKLFSPFQRLHPASEFEGNGIGLAMVQRILRRHQGRVWAEGVPGAGATFFFRLPGPD